MPQRITARVSCEVAESFRVASVRGMFDLPAEKTATREFSVEVRALAEPWQIGLIVGPSGSGKTTVARRAFGDAIYAADGTGWHPTAAVVDGFGEAAGIREITQSLSSVGFSAPPGWVKPYHVLSNGEKFRCDLARALMDDRPVVAFDEFASVVDRTVAKIGSAAVAKAIRSGRIKRRFVAISCHYDIAEWLCPDWVLDMASGTLARGAVRRPEIKIEIVRADRAAWDLFRHHHYLDTTIHHAAACFVGLVEGRPAAFVAALSFPHPDVPGWREHRCVCLPDFQGVGIGNRLSEFVAGLYRATGKPYTSTTSHPAMMRYRAASRAWEMKRKPGRVGVHKRSNEVGMANTSASHRLTAGFKFIGPPAAPSVAASFGIKV